MKKIFYIIIILCLTVSLNSCSSDDDDSPVQSNKEMLTDKSWVVSSKTVSPSISMGGVEVSNIMLLETEEVRNYSFKYNNDNTLIMYDYLGTQIFQTTWTINSEENKVNHTEPIIYTYPIVGGINISEYKIESITTNEMVATISFQYEEIDYVVTITFI